MLRSRVVPFILLMLALVAALPVSSARRSFDLVEVLAPEGYQVEGYSLSDNGRVAGELQPVGPGEPRGFVSYRGKISVLPPLPTHFGSSARAVNAKGQVVGYSVGENGQTRGVIWTKQKTVVLLPVAHADLSEATAINARGAVAGASDGAVVWAGRTVLELGLFPNGWYSFSTGINKRGEVVGHGGVPGGHSHAFLWSRDELVDLGTLPDDLDSYAVDINDRGEVAGYGLSPDGQRFHPVVWRRNQIIDLPILPGASDGFVHAINAGGVIAGASGVNGEWRRAVIWNGDEILDLNTLLPADSGLELSEVFDINKRGEVLVQGWDAGRRVFWVGRLP
jgi:probable HAF family extracellular repeat protein